jgi:C-terminal processing protease CtpA/Prc
MQDVYFWNTEFMQRIKYQVNPLLYGNVEDLLDFLRYQPDPPDPTGARDSDFTFVTTASSDEQFFGDGQYPGFGFFLSDLVAGDLFITEVFADSPADLGGFARGDRIVSIGGRVLVAATRIEDVFEALGPGGLGVVRKFGLEHPGGSTETVVLTTDVVTIDSLPTPAVFNLNGDMVGYMLFHSFIDPANQDLQDAFADFKAQGVTRLVVDLRYNGGGLISVAIEFLDLLGGPSHQDDVMFEELHNALFSIFDEEYFFEPGDNSIDLDQIVFITSKGSASASELVINSLLAYTDDIDIKIVGSQTFGKPVGQGGFLFCDDELVLRAVFFETVNADGDGGYYNGIAPDCAAEDDLAFALGDPMEASFDAALTVIETGICPPVTATTAFAAQAPPDPPDLTARGTMPWRREARAF